MTATTSAKPTLIWWGRADPGYSRNAVVRAAMRHLGWSIVDYRPGLRDPFGLASSTSLPRDAQLVWVPCFRQRDMKAAARFCKKRGVPLVFDPLISAYDKQVFERRKFNEGSPQAKRLKRWECDRFALADFVVGDTTAHTAYFHETFSVPRERLSVVPVGADEALFTPSPVGVQRDKPVRVLFYGSFIALQGPEVIAEAAIRCDACDWRLLGDGPLRPACEQITRGYSHIAYEPWVDMAKLPARIGRADILLGVFSDSAKAGRVVPNKVYQAMACGRPVITRRPLPGAFPWAGEAHPAHRSGVTEAEPNDPDALAQAVSRLAGDPERIAREGSAARQTFLRHGSLDRVAEAVAGVLERALSKGVR